MQTTGGTTRRKCNNRDAPPQHQMLMSNSESLLRKFGCIGDVAYCFNSQLLMPLTGATELEKNIFVGNNTALDNFFGPYKFSINPKIIDLVSMQRLSFSSSALVLLTAVILSPVNAWNCPCGYYCPNATLPYQHPVICPIGNYCPEGGYLKQTFPVKCPVANRCNKTGICSYLPATTSPRATTSAKKEIVAHPTSSTTPAPFKCGFYLPLGFPDNSKYQQPCRSGYYCPAGATPFTPIRSIKCPAGYYCGKETCHPSPCNCGYKCPAGSSSPIASEPPFYIPNKLATNQTLCPIGYKCDQPALCNATKCPNGTYVSCGGKKSCDPCPKGRYCPVVTKSVLCPAGYFCAGGVSAPTKCPANNFCPLGSSVSIACPAGKKSAAGAKSKSSCT